MTELDEVLPRQLVCYTFGYSCKDLSTLNNSSSSWREGCISEGLGSTGPAWKGKVEMVCLCRPLWLFMENVPAACTGPNFQNVWEELLALGHCL